MPATGRRAGRQVPVCEHERAKGERATVGEESDRAGLHIEAPGRNVGHKRNVSDRAQNISGRR